MRPHNLLATLAALLTLSQAPTASAQCPLGTYASNDATSGDLFGSFARDGQRLIVSAAGQDASGTNSGAAYLFERQATGNWQEVVKLQASDGTPNDAFGSAQSLSGDLVVIGARTDSPTAQFSGSAYVFERDTTGAWMETAKLIPNDGGVSHLFGSAVLIVDDNEILVGAPQASLASVARGAVYVFQRTASGWVQTGRLSGNSLNVSAGIGSRLERSGDWLAVVANPIDAPQASRVVLFQRIGGNWVEKQALTPAGTNVKFGTQRLVLCTPHDSSLVQFAGTARVFSLISGTWVETAAIAPPVPAPFGFFGLSASFEGNRIAIGSRANGSTIHLFETGASGWQEVRQIAGPAGHMGWGDIELNDERMLVSAQDDGPGRLTEFFTEPTEEYYCSSTPNSTGMAARISATACNRVSDNSFRLEATPVPNQLGLFYFGTHADSAPFGAGLRCVGGLTFRFPVSAAQNGVLSLETDFTDPSSPANSILAGNTWYFQAWFRDSGSAGSFNLSDAVSVRFL